MERRSLMSMIRIAAVITFILPASVDYAQEGEFVANGTNGSINWSKGIIRAEGIGVPDGKHYDRPEARSLTMEAARLDAMQNLLEIAKGVRIDSETLVRDLVADSNAVSVEIERMVRDAVVVGKPTYVTDGTRKITVQMSMNGGFAQLILPQEIEQIEPIRSVAAKPQPSASPLASASTPEANSESDAHTGLVVDARGLGVQPAMAPRVLDEHGQEVYGSAFVSREFAVQQGMSGYARSLAAAQSQPRVADRPLTIKGLRREGPAGSDIVVSNADASRLRGLSEHLSFLRECRVMVVVD